MNKKNKPVQKYNSQRSSWLDTKWKKRKQITLSRRHIPGKVTRFPLLIDLSNETDLAQHASPDGRDIVFTSADGTTRLPSYQVVHQRLLRDQAVWTIWSGPRAVRYTGNQDKTYVAYYTTNRGWWISSYDHNNDSWQHYKLRSHEQSAEGRWWDDHNNPAITIRNDGRILVVYGEHSTDQSWSRISEHPENITSWNNEIPFTQEQRIANRINFKPWFFAKRVWAKLTNTTRPTVYDPAYSYVNLYSLPDGTIWRQYRPLTTWSGISRQPTFVLSRDGGNTWSKPVRFIKETNRSPYLVTAQQGNNIHFFFSDAHPDEWSKTSIYHAYYDHSKGTYHKSDGELIGDASCLPFTPAQATKIYDGTTAAGEAWVYDITIDEEGRIAGLFNVYSGEKENKKSHQIHEYWYAFWDGKEWKTSKIDSESNIFSTGQRRYSGGFVVDTVDLSQVYLSLVNPDGTEDGFTRHIWRYKTDDNGSTWNRTRISRQGQGKAHSRPVVPVNRHPDLPVLWQYGHYVNYLEYHTALAAGDHGTLNDTQYYVQIAELNPDEDLTLYVYYGDKSTENQTIQTKSNTKIRSSSCLLSYKGTLSQNSIGQLSLQKLGTALTFEISAVWASDRKGKGEAAILSSEPKAETQFWIGKSANNTLEVRLLTSSGKESIVFDDLAFKTRDWEDAAAVPERSVIQLSILKDGTVYARLNAQESRVKKTLTHYPNLSPADLGCLYTAPEPENDKMPFQGWIEAVHIYEGRLDKSWLNISAKAEQMGALLVEVGKEEDLSDTQ
ncbi:BNR-4 repeat-containing protein [Rhodohalobacter sp. 8-1]|uniref:BNR-4 repeat-containing protein n=1 Tax=Rhodohalobacter sp. 8-1 TaxID=3131972 RepID=UPI0030EE6D3F